MTTASLQKALLAPAPTHAPRRRAAFLWAGVVCCMLASTAAVAATAVPRPPPGMPFHWPPLSAMGVGIKRFAAMLGGAAAVAAGLTAFQQLVMWPLLTGTSRQKSEKIFFSSSLAVVVVFATSLLRMHFGPNPFTPGGSPGDDTFVLMLFALWYGHEINELAQMRLRRAEFSPSFLGLMEPHHVISMGWFGAWMLVAAPNGPEGVPLWNTGILYLCGCAPNEVYKLISLYYKPKWLGWLIAPATFLHWMVLLVSQAYWFTQCPCMASGCWFPGSLIPLLGGWAMAVFDMPFFFNAFITNNSRMLGVPMTWAELAPLILNKAAPAVAAAAAAAAAASDSDDDENAVSEEAFEEASDEAARDCLVHGGLRMRMRMRPLVKVELVLRGGGAARKGAAGPEAAEGEAAAARAAK